MDFEWWFASQLFFVAVIAFLHHVGVIEVEMWIPPWLRDSVEDL